MSKNDIANGNMNLTNLSDANCDTKGTSKSNFQDGQIGKENDHHKQQQQQRPQQNVRQIPIFVEGRDEPLMNNVDLGASFGSTPKSMGTTPEVPRPSSSSIFSRVKDIPVRVIPNFDAARRSTSPATSTARNIPIHVQHSATKATQQQNVHSEEDKVRKSPSPCPSQPQDPITKIQVIQKEIIHLMEKVETFEGIKESREYVYLDEMLTQNLLKLDTIDTEGKESIKAARKEVINCINKCIAALEAKAGANESLKKCET